MKFEDLSLGATVEVQDHRGEWHPAQIKCRTERLRDGIVSVIWTAQYGPGHATFIREGDISRVRWPVPRAPSPVVAAELEKLRLDLASERQSHDATRAEAEKWRSEACDVRNYLSQHGGDAWSGGRSTAQAVAHLADLVDVERRRSKSWEEACRRWLEKSREWDAEREGLVATHAEVVAAMATENRELRLRCPPYEAVSAIRDVRDRLSTPYPNVDYCHSALTSALKIIDEIPGSKK